MVIELPKHTIEHVFDDPAKKMKSCIDPNIYIFGHTPKMKFCISYFFCVTLTWIEEYFLSMGIWGELGVENFWLRGPAPTKAEQRAIRRVDFV